MLQVPAFRAFDSDSQQAADAPHATVSPDVSRTCPGRVFDVSWTCPGRVAQAHIPPRVHDSSAAAWEADGGGGGGGGSSSASSSSSSSASSSASGGFAMPDPTLMDVLRVLRRVHLDWSSGGEESADRALDAQRKGVLDKAHLPISPHISPYLPISPHISPEEGCAGQGAERQPRRSRDAAERRRGGGAEAARRQHRG